MNEYDLNPHSLSVKLETSDTVVRNILNARNEPGFKLINNIIQRFVEISPEWLLTGNGQMKRVEYQKKFIEQRIDEIEIKVSGLGQLLPLMKPKSEEAANILAKFLESNPDLGIYGTDPNKKKV